MATNTVQPGPAPANPSRRSALGIFATAPVAMLPALAVMQCSERADAAVSGFRATLDRYNRAYTALNEAPLEILDDDPEGAIVSEYERSFAALVDAPAITPADFAAKFEALWRDEGNPCAEIVEGMFRDARRLSARA